MPWPSSFGQGAVPRYLCRCAALGVLEGGPLGKKLAEKIVDDDQLTARTKMRAIAKAMAKTKTPRPGSVHVVVRKGGKSTVAKGGGKPKVKFVDRRMRADERGLQQKAKGHKRRKKGQKRGGRRR